MRQLYPWQSPLATQSPPPPCARWQAGAHLPTTLAVTFGHDADTGSMHPVRCTSCTDDFPDKNSGLSLQIGVVSEPGQCNWAAQVQYAPMRQARHLHADIWASEKSCRYAIAGHASHNLSCKFRQWFASIAPLTGKVTMARTDQRPNSTMRETVQRMQAEV